MPSWTMPSSSLTHLGAMPSWTLPSSVAALGALPS
jgi:hypothetical protein